MKYFIFFAACFFPILSSAQTTATVDVTFENSRNTTIEQRSFFKFRKVPNNFETIKVDANHYKINYLDSTPSVIYVNFRPILVTPKDNVKVNYKVLISNYERMIDTISATGGNAQNYVFSNFFNSKLIPGDSFPDLRDNKYQRNSILLYDDLVKAYQFRDAYYSLNLKKENYQNDIPHLIKRMSKIEFLSNALSLATELGEKYESQYPAFAKKLDEEFLNTKFIEADTAYTYRMEEVFYSYFWHLYKVRFHPIDSKGKTLDLIKFIKNYPNHFVRDYFIFFLSADLGEISNKYALADVDILTQSISNKRIIKELQYNKN